MSTERNAAHGINTSGEGGKGDDEHTVVPATVETGPPSDDQVPDMTVTRVGEAPEVLKGDAAEGEVAVDTASLRVFAENMTELRDLASAARDQIADVDVQPGAFAAAHAIRVDVNQQGREFYVVLKSLVEGLEDLSLAMTGLAAAYDETEDHNTVEATDLETMLSEAEAQFTAVVTPKLPQNQA